jgi:hypothetical protein
MFYARIKRHLDINDLYSLIKSSKTQPTTRIGILGYKTEAFCINLIAEELPLTVQTFSKKPVGILEGKSKTTSYPLGKSIEQSALLHQN